MAGKAPLLLAMVLFSVGAVGLALTSAERASWGPFEPPNTSIPEQHVIIVDLSPPLVEPFALGALFTSGDAGAVLSEEPEFFVQAPAEDTPAPEPTPTPIPPLKVFGIASDDGGVSAAAATPSPPPPIRIGGIAFDDEASDTPDPEATETPAANSPDGD